MLVVNIVSEFKTPIKKSKCKHCKVYDFIDVKIEEDTILQPDCSIVCKSIHKKFLDFSATLVVEILSPATALKDRHTKFSLYEKFGIKYHMIVDEEKEKVEIYGLDHPKYILQNDAEKNLFTFHLDDDCNIRINMKNFWE